MGQMFSSWGWRKWDDLPNFGRFWSGIKCLYIKHFTCPFFYPRHCCCNQLLEGGTWQSFGSGASSTSGFLSKGFSEMLEGTHFFKHSLEIWVSLHPMRQILTNGNESKWLSASFFIPMRDNFECIPWVPQGCWQNKTRYPLKRQDQFKSFPFPLSFSFVSHSTSFILFSNIN